MAVALGIMVWGGAQWLGNARKALPFTAAPSPSDPPFPICKMKRADPKMAGVQKYNLRAHTTACSVALPSACLSINTTSSSTPLTEPDPLKPDILQWGMEFQRGDRI